MSIRKFSEYAKYRFQEEILREAEIQHEDLKLAIQAALGEMAQGKDEEDWMALDTKNLSRQLQDAILELGEVKRTAGPERLLDIRKSVRNGISIKELMSVINNEGGPKPVHTDKGMDNNAVFDQVPHSAQLGDFETM